MAAIQITGNTPARGIKKNINVDFTPLVDLGFLLITFFVFTAALAEPHALHLIMPNDKGADTPVKESGVLTILPGENGIIHYYEGLGGAGIRQCNIKTLRGIILQKKSTTARNNPVIIISPLPRSAYAALVNVLDEMIITGIQRYAIVDISEKDAKDLQLL